MEHHLKTHPAPFADVRAGRKTFEIRSKEDRDFAVGDTLVLEEWDGEKREAYVNKYMPVASGQAWYALVEEAVAFAYTGQTERRTVTYIFDPQGERYGLEAGYVVLGMEVHP